MFQKAYGLANRDAKMPVMASTRFNIASIGKAFTKTAVGQLVAQGRLALTDTIGKGCRTIRTRRRAAATVDQLLNHQAGIADFFGPAFDAAPKSQFASNADYYRFVAPQPLLFDPGTKRQVLQRLLRRARRDHREGVRASATRTTSPSTSSSPPGMFGAGFFRSDRLPAGHGAAVFAPTARARRARCRTRSEAHGVTGSAAGGRYAARRTCWRSTRRCGRGSCSIRR